MSDLNYVVVKCGASKYKKHKFVIIYTSYTIILRKNIVARCVELYCKRPTD